MSHSACIYPKIMQLHSRHHHTKLTSGATKRLFLRICRTLGRITPLRCNGITVMCITPSSYFFIFFFCLSYFISFLLCSYATRSVSCLRICRTLKRITPLLRKDMADCDDLSKHLVPDYPSLSLLFIFHSH